MISVRRPTFFIAIHLFCNFWSDSYVGLTELIAKVWHAWWFVLYLHAFFSCLLNLLLNWKSGLASMMCDPIPVDPFIFSRCTSNRRATERPLIVKSRHFSYSIRHADDLASGATAMMTCRRASLRRLKKRPCIAFKQTKSFLVRLFRFTVFHLKGSVGNAKKPCPQS